MVATQHEVKENKLIPLTLLFPHSQNYRQHPPEQIRKLKASLERWGQVRSIVTQEHANGSFTIVAGHGVFLAAEELGYQELRADILPQDWTPAQVNGYLVADNLLNSDAVDDENMIAELLSEQQNAGYDLASVGSDEETLRQMLASLGDDILAEDAARTRTTELNEPAGGDVQSGYNILITCATEEEQQRAYDLATKEGFTCKVLTL